jgi:aspartate kinase
MAIIVHKYGGSSLADPSALHGVAQAIVSNVEQGHQMVVVVSAMGGATDDLVALAGQVTRGEHRREMDMLLSTGERVTMALLSMAIRDRGCEAISFTGSQCGIITDECHADARIVEVRPYRVEKELAAGRVVIVAGFQGMSRKREITTLGRGGSDTTALALAAALDASRCVIFSDVDGVLSADPRTVQEAHLIDRLAHGELEALARAGAGVLNADAVAWARRNEIEFEAARTGAEHPGTLIVTEAPHSGVRAITSSQERLFVAAPILPGLLLEAAPFLVHLSGDGLLLNSANLHGSWPADARPCRTVSAIGDGIERDPSVLGRFTELCADAESIWSEPGALHARFVEGFESDQRVRLLHAEWLA